MYGIRGERRLSEVELHWLAGYEGARPVRVGNAAYEQSPARRVSARWPSLLYDASRRLRGAHRPEAVRALLDIARLRREQCGESRTAASGRCGARSARSPPRRSRRGRRSIARSDIRRARPRRGRSTIFARPADAIFDEVCSDGLQPQAQHLHAVLRRHGTRRESPLHPASGFLPADRSSGRRHRRGDRAGAPPGRAAAALQARGRRRRALRRGRGLPRVLVLARRRLSD